MKIRYFLAILAVCSLSPVLSGQERNIRAELQSNPNRYGGSSAPYEFTEHDSHPAPDGYTPFYISHFGRHGSRMHTSEDMFKHLRSVFHAADSMNVLTEEGRRAMDLFVRADRAMEGKLGELTDLGAREHRDIASRMYADYKEIFESGSGKILAQSTTSERVMESMHSFCSELKIRNKSLKIKEEADDKTNRYLNHYTRDYKDYYKNGEWRKVRDDWQNKNLDISAFTLRLFMSADIFGGNPNGHKAKRFAQDMYSLAKIMPASNLGFGFYDFFTEDELWHLWQIGNMDQYMRKGPSSVSGGLAVSIAKPLLSNFVERAQNAMADPSVCADLRFGHGEGLMPLAALMGIEEASAQTSDPDAMAAAWQDYRVTTMAGNIQWIFYRNNASDVLVKILLNEREARIPVSTDVWPYYHWNDVLKYYNEPVPASGVKTRIAKEINSAIKGQLNGVYYIHDFDMSHLSPAPKGFEACMISHYGRHGARYQDKERAYTSVLEKLEAGHDSGMLTPFGESVFKALSDFFSQCKGHYGELTRVGWEQHREIAHKIYDLYSSVFKKNPEIIACSSTSHRCVMSMTSFCMGLKEKAPGLDIYAQCSKTLLDEVNPSDKSNTNYVERPIMDWPWSETYEQYVERRISREEAETVTLRLFKDVNYARKHFSCRKFSVSLYNLISSMDCVYPAACVEGVFTDDELFDYFETVNVGYFEWGAIKKEYAKPILASIINDAREDLQKGRPTVRLRFGHDTCLQALLHLIDVEDMGKVPGNIDDLSLTWHCWMTPMAATLEFIFYKNKRGDVLVQPVLNGAEVKICKLQPYIGSFYRWEDFQTLL